MHIYWECRTNYDEKVYVDGAGFRRLSDGLIFEVRPETIDLFSFEDGRISMVWYGCELPDAEEYDAENITDFDRSLRQTALAGCVLYYFSFTKDMPKDYQLDLLYWEA